MDVHACRLTNLDKVLFPAQAGDALIDIDPGAETSWDDVLVLARLYRAALQHVGVTGVPKLTGGRGFHIWVPVHGGYTFEDTRRWVEALSAVVGHVAGDLVSWRWDKRGRGGKPRLDYTHNAINKTLLAPYSPRAAAGAPVSAPISWDELDDADLRPDRWTIRTLPARLAATGDLFAPALERGQTLPGLR